MRTRKIISPLAKKEPELHDPPIVDAGIDNDEYYSEIARRKGRELLFGIDGSAGVDENEQADPVRFPRPAQVSPPPEIRTFEQTLRAELGENPSTSVVERILRITLTAADRGRIRVALAGLGDTEFEKVQAAVIQLREQRARDTPKVEYIIGDVVRATPLGSAPTVGVVVGGGKYLRMWPVDGMGSQVVNADWATVSKVADQPRCGVEGKRVHFDARQRLNRLFGYESRRDA